MICFRLLSLILSWRHFVIFFEGIIEMFQAVITGDFSYSGYFYERIPAQYLSRILHTKTGDKFDIGFPGLFMELTA